MGIQVRKIVLIESPFRGKGRGLARLFNERRNKRYAHAALKDALTRGEVPLASHLLYTQVLDDQNPDDRKMGIDVGHEFLRVADAVVVYIDRGISDGMNIGIARARALGLPVMRRSIPGWSRGHEKRGRAY
jgi:hypothetical protein